MGYPAVLSEEETIDAALSGMSLARFGDGELRLAIGKECTSQRKEKNIAADLRRVLAYPGPQLLTCIPNIDRSPRFDVWKEYKRPAYSVLMPLPVYGSSFVTRPDNIPAIDRPDYWNKIRQLWTGRDVILVVGDEKSLTAQRMPEAKSVRVIQGSRQHAYTEIPDIEARIKQAYGPSSVVIMCLGAAATVLAKRLSDQRIWALDLGHIGMFMKHEGLYRFAQHELISEIGIERARKTIWPPSDVPVEEIVQFRTILEANSTLDYGCGAESVLQKSVSFRVYEYDPAIPGKNNMPKPVDLVVVCNVLEYVEPELLPNVMEHVRLVAGKGIFITINVSVSKNWKVMERVTELDCHVLKFLRRGDQMHICLRK